MPKGLDQDELIERWTLVGEELERCRAKRGVNGLAFAVLEVLPAVRTLPAWSGRGAG